MISKTDKSAKRRVAVVLVDRANYGRLKPVMRAIQSHPQLELQVVAAGTMMLERFSQPTKVVAQDGFTIDDQVFMELEGSNPVTMAKSLGFGVIEFTTALQRLDPDLVLLIGDRYEALAAALAAAYMNKCLVHLQGGEVSGSIDESARHAITKLSQFHFPATRQAARFVERMGEHPDTILGVGCPGSDIARQLDRTLASEVINAHGSGAEIDVTRPFLLVVFHPTTTEYGGEETQTRELLTAVERLQTPTVLLWPNIDAGSNRVSKAIRTFRLRESHLPLRTLVNLAPEDYLKVLSNTACAVGNSSSFVRDAGYFGTPVVLVGQRQDGRETDRNVVRVPCQADPIVEAVAMQLRHGRYEASTLYGDGWVGPRVAEALAELTPYVQKRLAYAETTHEILRQRAA